MLKKGVMVLVVALLFYGLGVGLLWSQQDRLLYQGTRLPTPRAGFGSFSLPRPGLILRGWVVNPGRRKAVVVFGGNAMAMEGFAPYLGRLTERTVYVIPYRGFEGQAGAPSQEVMVGDGEAVVTALESSHPDGIALLGISLGSGVAVQVARAMENRPLEKNPVDRLVLVTPFDSIRNVVRFHLPFVPSALVRDTWDSARAIRDVTIPVWVLRANRDEVVPSLSTDRLLGALPRPPVRVETLPTSHNGVWEAPHAAQTRGILHAALDGPVTVSRP